MKIFRPISTVLSLALALSSSSAVNVNAIGRDLHMGMGGRGGGRMSFLEAVEGGKCEEEGLCEGAESLDCDNLERPSQGDDTDLSALKEARIEFRKTILQCVCCNEASLEELTEGLGGKGGGGRIGKGKLTQELVDKKCDTGEVDCPVDLSCDDIERPDKSEFMTEEGMDWAAMKEARQAYRQKILSCACCTDTSLEDLGVPSMSGGRVQAILEKRCPVFQEENECPAVSAECTRLGPVDASWEERRNNLLECVCCREDGVEAINEGGDVEASVLLASLMADESVVQTEESYSASSAASLSFVLSSFVVTVAAAFV